MPGRDDRVDRGRRPLVRGEGSQAARRRGRRRARTARRGVPPRALLSAGSVSGRRRSPACRAGWRRPRRRRSRHRGRRPRPGRATSRPARVTSWPRRSSPAITSSPSRSSTTAPAGVHARGQNESTSAVVCSDGRVDRLLRRCSRPTIMRSSTGSCHCSCWSPPGVPSAISARPVAQHERGRQRRARARPGAQGGGGAGIEPRHLQPGAEAEPELGDRRRGLQPAARGRDRDHVAPAVDDVDVARVAAGVARPHDRRLAGAGDRAASVRSGGRNGARPGTAPGRHSRDAVVADLGAPASTAYSSDSSSSSGTSPSPNYASRSARASFSASSIVCAPASVRRVE